MASFFYVKELITIASYSYRCMNEECKNNNDFEVIANMSDPTPEICELCGGEVKRVYTRIAVNLNFKGSYNSTR